jgi:hypothetical protein
MLKGQNVDESRLTAKARAGESANTTRNQTGLNGLQAIVDDDGITRFVIRKNDPGIANWLDPMGLPVGQRLFRWYDGKTPANPSAKVAKCDDLDALLHLDTPRVSMEMRAVAMMQRSRDLLQRWGF